jgi:hypothetical protein
MLERRDIINLFGHIMKLNLLISKDYLILFLNKHLFLHRRTSEERSTTLDVVNDRHAYPSLIFSRVKSYTLAAEQPLK